MRLLINIKTVRIRMRLLSTKSIALTRFTLFITDRMATPTLITMILVIMSMRQLNTIVPIMTVADEVVAKIAIHKSTTAMRAGTMRMTAAMAANMALLHVTPFIAYSRCGLRDFSIAR